jgi:uncharacterized protein
MFVAIISDVHNNEVNLKKVLNHCAEKEIKTIICCGDLASLETLKLLSDSFAGIVYYVFGNMDRDQLQDLELAYKHKNIKIFQPVGEVELESKKIAFVHYPKVAKELAETGKYNFVFYGHTHRPWEEMIGKCKMLNPGNVAGEIYPPTFAIWNTEDDKFELTRIHDLK